MYVDLGEKIIIPFRNKKLYVKNVYFKERDERFSSLMIDNSFILEGTSVEFRANPQTSLDKMSNIGRYIDRMEQRGYCFNIPTFDDYEEIERIIKDSGILKDYHIKFRTNDEKRKLPNGTYMCIKKDDEIVAGSIGDIENGVGRLEDVAIKDPYKMKGLAPIITYNRMKWMVEKNVQHATGWILMNNDASLSYHIHLGDKLKNKYCDEWIKENGR